MLIGGWTLVYSGFALPTSSSRLGLAWRVPDRMEVRVPGKRVPPPTRSPFSPTAVTSECGVSRETDEFSFAQVAQVVMCFANSGDHALHYREAGAVESMIAQHEINASR